MAVRGAKATSHLYEIDNLVAPARAAAALLSVYAVVQAILKGDRTKPPLRSVLNDLLNWVQGQEDLRFDPFDYFELPDPTQLKRSSSVLAGVHRFIRHKYEQLGAIPSPGDRRILECLKDPKEYRKGSRGGGSPASHLRIFEEKVDPVTAVLREVFRSGRADVMFCHPTYQWRNVETGELVSIPALSPHSIKLFLYGLSPDYRRARPNAGLFYVIREARGVFVEGNEPRNCLVRDVLWLRSLREPQARNTTESGYYFSAFDRSVYDVSGLETEPRGQVRLSGGSKATDRHDSALPFHLSFAPFRNHAPLRNRIGLLAGSTVHSIERPAAWKVLIVAVPKSEHDVLELALETIAGQEDPAFLPSNREEMLLQYLFAEGRIGVVTAREMPEAAQSSPAAGPVDRGAQFLEVRRTFKQLVALPHTLSDDPLSVEMFEHLLGSEYQQIANKGEGRKGRHVSDLIRLIIRNWAALEPAQLILQGPPAHGRQAADRAQ
jgi:hypothetical protein